MRERVRDGSIRYGNTWFVLSYGAELSDPSLSLDSEHPAGLQNRNGPAWSSEVSVKRPFICLDPLFSCRGVAARTRPKARVSVPVFCSRAHKKPAWLGCGALRMAPALSPATPCSARSPKAARAQNAGKCKVRM